MVSPMKFLRRLFSYEPSQGFEEVPKEEPPDSNAGLCISDAASAARRNLMATCGLGIAWSTAQFTLADPKVEVVGLPLDLSNASYPIVLAVLICYFTARWLLEFSMMSRDVRRWRLAQIDFHVTWTIARVCMLAVAAGALDRSLWTVVRVGLSLGLVALASVVLSVVLMFVLMPIRMWARARADKISAASAAFEALNWATYFSIWLTGVGILALGVASYAYPSLRHVIWSTPPSPIALSVLVLTLLLVFLSHWTMRPVIKRIFSTKPSYYTTRLPDGNLQIHFPACGSQGPLVVRQVPVYGEPSEGSIGKDKPS